MLPDTRVAVRYRFGPFTLSPRQRTLVRGDRELRLIPRYLDLLIFLVEHRHEAVHRTVIFERVWADVIVSDSALAQAIRTLRRTLGDDTREPVFIRTISRHGYQFVFADVSEEPDGPSAPPTIAVPESQVRRLVALAGRRASLGAAGGGVAGAVAGAIGGILLSSAPGSGAPLGIAVVLALVGAACGLWGGAAVAFGAAMGELGVPSHGGAALVAGGAVGGAAAGGTAQWLGRAALATLVGVHVPIGGTVEGLALGLAAGLGLAVATRYAELLFPGSSRQRRALAAAVTAAACAAAALALSLLGLSLVGGTIHAIAQASAGSEAALTPLSRLLGEPAFGPVTRALLGMGEGAVFGAGLALGLTHPLRAIDADRRKSTESHTVLTNR
jgi:DNA-binding winged helix-turn-helix (wHTH) protein